jgi:FtsP/CotA-like multicopper oxidase with cupredoxin domain
MLMCSFVTGQSQKAAPVGRVRTYYIAADEVNWDYAPSGKNLIYDEKYHFQDDPASKGTLNPNATVYRKAVFNEYTDSNFRILKPRSEDWVHLGILGPLIRAEVGDTIKVVFRNNASHPFTLHPHGVLYLKESEGAGYQDNTSGEEKADDSVAPGATYTYNVVSS